MGSSLSSVSDLLRHRRTMPRFKITAILLVLAMIVSSPPTVDANNGHILNGQVLWPLNGTSRHGGRHWDRALEVAYQPPPAQCGHN